MGKPLYVLFLITIVVTASGCLSGEEESTPENTVEKYYEGLNDRDPEQIIDVLSEDVIDSAGGEKNLLATLQGTVDDLEENSLVFEIEEMTSSIIGLQAIVEAHLKIYPKGATEASRIPYTFYLKLEDGAWKIQDIG